MFCIIGNFICWGLVIGSWWAIYFILPTMEEKMCPKWQRVLATCFSIIVWNFIGLAL